ncbi:MAG TPA: peptidase [Alphaproteobacteria bacterium]|nr:peptidase [Alphaproteobacteria bacterium]HAJ45816.1 peptidase [Alphaproteobacteria bacterium]
MSYALGIRVEDGLILAADSRTNAGPDHVSAFRKLHVFERPGERLIGLAVIGNLSLAQSLVAVLRGNGAAAGRPKSLATEFMEASSMTDAVRIVGEAVRAVELRDGAALSRHNITFDVTVLAGGQIGKERHRLFQVYPAGNFIEASEDAPYFQIGERKYGKAVLDQTIQARTDLSSAYCAALLSMDATMQNNATVGPPIDILALERDRLRPSIAKRVLDDDQHMADVRRRWSAGIRDLVSVLPEPPGLSARTRTR